MKNPHSTYTILSERMQKSTLELK